MFNCRLLGPCNGVLGAFPAVNCGWASNAAVLNHFDKVGLSSLGSAIMFGRSVPPVFVRADELVTIIGKLPCQNALALICHPARTPPARPFRVLPHGSS